MRRKDQEEDEAVWRRKREERKKQEEEEEAEWKQRREERRRENDEDEEMLRRKRGEQKLQELEDIQRFEKLREERQRMWEEQTASEQSSTQPSLDALCSTPPPLQLPLQFTLGYSPLSRTQSSSKVC